MTWAINSRSGRVIAMLRKSFLRLSGRFDRPAYPGFTERIEESARRRVETGERTGDEDTGILTQPKLSSDEFDFGSRIVDSSAETKLNRLNLLRYSTEDTFF